MQQLVQIVGGGRFELIHKFKGGAEWLRALDNLHSHAYTAEGERYWEDKGGEAGEGGEGGEEGVVVERKTDGEKMRNREKKWKEWRRMSERVWDECRWLHKVRADAGTEPGPLLHTHTHNHTHNHTHTHTHTVHSDVQPH